MPATFNDGMVKGRNTKNPITKKRFVTADTTATDGETVIQSGHNDATPPIGVSKFSVSAAEITQGKGVSVIMDGRAIVTAAAVLTVGQRVTSDPTGQAVVAVAGDWLCGTVDEPATAIGNDCTVLLADPGTKA